MKGVEFVFYVMKVNRVGPEGDMVYRGKSIAVDPTGQLIAVRRVRIGTTSCVRILIWRRSESLETEDPDS